MEFCPGHFGVIKFFKMIVHPLCYRYVLNYIRCICKHCHRFLLTEEFMGIENLFLKEGMKRFNDILLYIENDMICTHCNKNQPKYLFNKFESKIYMFYRDKDHKMVVTPSDIYEILIDVTPDDMVLMGFSPKTRPANLLLKNLPVLPPASRPYIISDGKTCDDDLTYKYVEIVKINNKLKKVNLQETQRNNFLTSLEFHVKTLFDNTKGKAKQTNGREMKCIKKRVCGKGGQIRKHLSGKRGNFNARTVITGDPLLSLEEMGIPHEIAENLTIPEIVNGINMEKMTSLMRDGKINKVVRNGETHNMKYALKSNLMYQTPDGKWETTVILDNDVIIRGDRCLRPNTIKMLKDIDFNLEVGDILHRGKHKYPIRLPSKRKFTLKTQDIVERHLENGDYVLLNRQPTLHLGSMMSFKLVITRNKTFTLPLAITTSFNADFDGDEMNIHVPQSYEARIELMHICSVRCNMVSPQANNPNIVVIQDALLGSYLLTRPGTVIGRDAFFQCTMVLDDRMIDRLDYIEEIQREYHKRDPCWCNIHKRRRVDYHDFSPCECRYNGHNLFSLALPPDLHYKKKNGADEDQPTLIIYKGVVVEGAVNKAILGGSQTSLLLSLHHEYSPEVSVRFIDNITRIATEYLLCRSFSVGLGDMVPKETKYIDEAIQTQFLSAKCVMNTIKNPSLKEIQVNMCLNKGKDVGQKIAQKSLNSRNSLKSMVIAGSKGNYINIAQIIGTIGQQTISGQRIEKTRSGGERTLPHYQKGLEAITHLDPSEKNMTNLFESRGFVTSSYIKGLNPQEFFFHAFGGREGLVDTSMKSVTGDTPIIIIEGGVSMYVKIGDWIDQKLMVYQSSVEYHTQRNMELLKVGINNGGVGEGIMIPTVDAWGVVSWGAITAVTRHDPGVALYRVTTIGGRSVVVTESKSLLIWSQGEFRHTSTPEVKVGDFMPTTMYLPPPPVLKGGGLYEKYSDGVVMGLMAVTGEIEGVCATCPQIKEFINGWSKDNSHIESLLCRGDCRNKYIPDGVFSAPSEFVKGLINGCISGCGVVVAGGIRIVSLSRKLLEGFNMVCSRVGVFGRISVCASSVVSLTIEGSMVGVLLESVHLLHKRKREALELYKSTNPHPLYKNDVILDEIVEIERLTDMSLYPKVYDLTVPSTLNFGLANGLHVVDTAESGYIQRRIIKKLEDCKIQYDGTVRNAQGRIIQFSYGSDGLNPSATTKIGDYKNPQICNVARIVKRLETSYNF
jgi:DNA-directed RNA polymerase beta' subunit/intein/homing endonuclease